MPGIIAIKILTELRDLDPLQDVPVIGLCRKAIERTLDHATASVLRDPASVSLKCDRCWVQRGTKSCANKEATASTQRTRSAIATSVELSHPLSPEALVITR